VGHRWCRAATAWPLAIRAQQPAILVIGFLGSRAPEEDPQLLTSFRVGLKEAGYVEGQNVAIVYHLPKINTTVCQRWQPISSSVRWL
jgi:hypothetical protein